jgi:hypothetical protein
MIAAMLACAVQVATAGPWSGPIEAPCWRLASPDGTIRWIEIHPVRDGGDAGVFHLQVLERRTGSAPWRFRSRVAHLAVTESALRASIVGPSQEKRVYPETFDAAYAAWQGLARTGARPPVCTTRILTCAGLATDH